VASNIRAMPENEKPPARRVDVYLKRKKKRGEEFYERNIAKRRD